jgi:hypothetical protein
MATSIRADNDTWSAKLGETGGPDTRTVVFFCTSNNQRPYRVVEVPRSDFAEQGDLDRLDDDELRDLFAATVSMGAPRSY